MTGKNVAGGDIMEGNKGLVDMLEGKHVCQWPADYSYKLTTLH